MKVPIAFCSSQDYLDYIMVAIWSVLMSRNESDEYEFFILHRDISQSAQNNFIADFSLWERQAIWFIDVSKWIAEYLPNTADIKETWFSLLMAECLPQCDKVIVLDGDVTVRHDLSELFATDVQGKLLAAALDPDFIGQYHGGNRFYQRYYAETVPIQDPYHYFQGGVYVLNLKNLRERFPKGMLFQAAANRYKYDDQDVFNLYCGDAVRILDMRWNVLYDSYGYRRKQIIGLAPPEVKCMYDEAREDPWIIHYAGGDRPWVREDCDFGEAFWNVADLTPIAEKLHGQLKQAANARKDKAYSIPRRCGRWVRYLIRGIRLWLKRDIQCIKKY